jgi:hypothetical protein
LASCLYVADATVFSPEYAGKPLANSTVNRIDIDEEPVYGSASSAVGQLKFTDDMLETSVIQSVAASSSNYVQNDRTIKSDLTTFVPSERSKTVTISETVTVTALDEGNEEEAEDSNRYYVCLVRMLFVFMGS